MKRNMEADERVVAQSRKVQSEALLILFWVLLISVIIQQFVFNAPFSQYAVEFFCFLGVSFYITVRKLMLGMNVFGERSPKRIMLTNVVVTGFTVALVNGVINYTRYSESYKGNMGAFALTLLITLISAMAASLAVILVFWYFNSKRRKAIQEQLDEEEDE